eukprot:TRINITY_DN4192_c0_g1_i2.p1 TRINITY_DN4192_c0_g1~~TRINITY_DN4192_c0_g1_i2.p1  ORF type:complete len:249 (+),score=59.90 TRINITY_DN4192_c0_g1_i2:51-797(+)
MSRSGQYNIYGGVPQNFSNVQPQVNAGSSHGQIYLNQANGNVGGIQQTTTFNNVSNVQTTHVLQNTQPWPQGGTVSSTTQVPQGFQAKKVINPGQESQQTPNKTINNAYAQRMSSPYHIDPKILMQQGKQVSVSTNQQLSNSPFVLNPQQNVQQNSNLKASVQLKPPIQQTLQQIPKYPTPKQDGDRLMKEKPMHHPEKIVFQPTVQQFEVPGSEAEKDVTGTELKDCLLYTSPSPRDRQKSRMPSSA